MINLERLRPPPREAPESIALATDEQVRGILSDKIEIIRQAIDKPFRIGQFPYSQLLYEIRGDSEMAHLTSYYDVVTKVEHDRLQNLAFEVMVDYGLDVNNNVEKPSHENAKEYGTISECMLFPSIITSGLIFERKHAYVMPSQEPFYLSWSVMDLGPFFKLDVGNLLRFAQHR